MLVLTGKAVEGDVLTALEVIPMSEIQQHIWAKYKKDVRYQWYSVTSEFHIAPVFHMLCSSSCRSSMF